MTRLNVVLEAMVGFIVARPEAGEFVQFVLRELSQPSEALDIIYDGVFEPVHNRLCRIWAQATGEDAESDRTKITVFTMIGQVVYFRIAGAGGDAAHGLGKRRPGGSGHCHFGGQRQSRGDPRRAQRQKTMSFLCAIPLAAWLFSACGPAAPLAVGYVEGEFVLLAPIEVAQVETVSVRRGDRVNARQDDRGAGKRRRRRSRSPRPRPPGAGRRLSLPTSGSASARKRSRCWKRRFARPRRRRRKPSACWRGPRISSSAASPRRRSSTRRPPRSELAECRGQAGRGQSGRGGPGGAGGDDQGGRIPGETGRGATRAGALAPFQACARSALARPHRRCHPQCRRHRRAFGAGDLDAARRRGQAEAVRAGGGVFVGGGRQPCSTCIATAARTA